MKIVRQAAMLLLTMTLITGVFYPFIITAIANIVAPNESMGDPRLIGRRYSDPRYFWGRPSATADSPYNALASSGSNLGPLSEALASAVRDRVAALHAAGDRGPPPTDLVTASASGLDPHISPAAAYYQAPRIANLRGLPLARLEALIARATETPTLAIFGASRVHVLTLNESLDNGEAEK